VKVTHFDPPILPAMLSHVFDSFYLKINFSIRVTIVTICSWPLTLLIIIKTFPTMWCLQDGQEVWRPGSDDRRDQDPLPDPNQTLIQELPGYFTPQSSEFSVSVSTCPAVKKRELQSPDSSTCPFAPWCPKCPFLYLKALLWMPAHCPI